MHIGITSNRIKHMLGVAKRCHELGQEYGLDENRCQELFVLGLVHDVGYEFTNDGEPTKHAEIGGAILKRLGFNLSDEVAQHGDIVTQSLELFILNCADMTVNSSGERVTMEERLEKILGNYGSHSIQYKNAKSMTELLRKQEEQYKCMTNTN